MVTDKVFTLTRKNVGSTLNKKDIDNKTKKDDKYHTTSSYLKTKYNENLEEAIDRLSRSGWDVKDHIDIKYDENKGIIYRS